MADVQKTFGAQGGLIIRLRPNAPEELDLDEPVFITMDGLPVPFYFKSFEPHGTRRAVVEFDDMETPGLAAELIGKTIELKTKNEGTKTDDSPHTLLSFLHYSVVDKNFGELGLVANFLDIPGNPCLQIDYKGRELIIPFHEAIIKKIDEKKQILHVVLPDGLLDV